MLSDIMDKEIKLCVATYEQPHIRLTQKRITKRDYRTANDRKAPATLSTINGRTKKGAATLSTINGGTKNGAATSSTINDGRSPKPTTDEYRRSMHDTFGTGARR